MWDNVEAIAIGQAGPGLSRSMSKLNRLHPSEMADIIEEMDSSAQVEIFSALDTVRAADVLEELEPDAQDCLLENLPSDKIADVLEIMPADEVADILDDVDKKKVEELLKEMDSEVSGEVRELMEYEDDVVGSIMMTDYLSFRESDTVETALETLRQKKPEYDTIYYLYVVSEKGALEATLSLRDIILSRPETRIGDIMNRDIVYARDTEKIESLNDMIAKYNCSRSPWWTRTESCTAPSSSTTLSSACFGPSESSVGRYERFSFLGGGIHEKQNREECDDEHHGKAHRFCAAG